MENLPSSFQKRASPVLYWIYFAIFLVLLASAAAQAAGLAGSGPPPWYVWPVAIIGGAVSLDGALRGGSVLRFIMVHDGVVLALALARLVRSSGDPNADPSDMFLPLVVLLAAPFLIYLRTKHEKEEEELEQKWREKQDSDPPPP